MDDRVDDLDDLDDGREASFRRSPGWALCFLSLAQPGERPAAASAPAKPLAAAVLSSKRPFSEGRPHYLGLISTEPSDK